MQFSASLSKTTTDLLKSKQQSPMLVQLVLDAYMTPREWATFIETYYDTVFAVEITEGATK